VTTRRRFSTIGLALAGASAIALAGVGMPWWSSEAVSVGPTYAAVCFGGECERQSLDGMGSASWERFGITTWGAGLIAMISLVVLAAALASHRPGRLAAKVALAGMLVAVATAAAFVLSFPADGKTIGMTMGPGLFLHFAGALLGTSAALVCLLAPKPAPVPGRR
jgi:hypothetical protein